MTLFERASGALSREDIPAVSQAVFDVTGAGDTCIAVFALCPAAGATRSQAARLANVAAGIVVSKRGTALVEQAELLERMCEVAGGFVHLRHADEESSTAAPRWGESVSRARLLKWKYSPSLLFSGANTLCSVVFQFANLAMLGVGARSDLYFASIVMPMVLFTIAFGALNNVLIPMFVEARRTRRQKRFPRFGTPCLLLLWVGCFCWRHFTTRWFTFFH